MSRHSLLKIEKGVSFPITVNFAIPAAQMHQAVLTKVRWVGNINLRKYTPPPYSGIKNFICRYATLTEESDLHNVQANAKANGIILADVMQFFAFSLKHIKAEVTEKKCTPIVAADPGSTWLCSHGYLGEMVGVEWDNFYHAPGPVLHTVSDSLKKGTRFLTICR